MYIAFLTLILNLPYKFLWAYEYSSGSYGLYGVYGVNLALVCPVGSGQRPRTKARLIQIFLSLSSGYKIIFGWRPGNEANINLIII